MRRPKSQDDGRFFLAITKQAVIVSVRQLSIHRRLGDPPVGNLGAIELLIIVVLVVAAVLIVKRIRRALDVGKKEFARSLAPNSHGKSTQQMEDPIVANHSSQKPSSAVGSGKVFISYRREDSADVTGRIYDRLVNELGKEQVFKDVDSLPFGVDFRRQLEDAVSNCSAMIVVIGDRWLTEKDSQGVRRLDRPNDFVRLEIEAALSRDIPVVPVLVRRAQIPMVEELPDSIRDLSFRNGIEVRADPDFHTDMGRLLSRLQVT
jgi:hypothetical protein